MILHGKRAENNSKWTTLKTKILIRYPSVTLSYPLDTNSFTNHFSLIIRPFVNNSYLHPFLSSEIVSQSSGALLTEISLSIVEHFCLDCYRFKLHANYSVALCVFKNQVWSTDKQPSVVSSSPVITSHQGLSADLSCDQANLVVGCSDGTALLFKVCFIYIDHTRYNI